MKKRGAGGGVNALQPAEARQRDGAVKRSYYSEWYQDGGPLLDGIAFNIDTRLWPDASVRHVELAYKLDVNEFRGNRSVQLLIEHIWPL